MSQSEMSTVTDNRSRRDRAATGDLAWWERIMFGFMGPAQIGDYKAPDGYVPDAAATLCHKCGQPWEAHERVHTGTMTYRKCPAAPHRV
jgi:hypothetical protein